MGGGREQEKRNYDILNHTLPDLSYCASQMFASVPYGLAGRPLSQSPNEQAPASRALYPCGLGWSLSICALWLVSISGRKERALDVPLHMYHGGRICHRTGSVPMALFGIPPPPLHPHLCPHASHIPLPYTRSLFQFRPTANVPSHLLDALSLLYLETAISRIILLL